MIPHKIHRFIQSKHNSHQVTPIKILTIKQIPSVLKILFTTHSVRDKTHQKKSWLLNCKTSEGSILRSQTNILEFWWFWQFFFRHAYYLRLQNTSKIQKRNRQFHGQKIVSEDVERCITQDIVSPSYG